MRKRLLHLKAAFWCRVADNLQALLKNLQALLRHVDERVDSAVEEALK